MNNFCVAHYNIQSILNKVDVLGAELKNFDIICLTETWLNPNISDDCPNIDGFQLYRRQVVTTEAIAMVGYVFMQKTMCILFVGQILNSRM